MKTWKCAKCRTEFQAVSKPICMKEPGCKNGMFVNQVTQQASGYDHAAQAAAWHYELDTTHEVTRNYGGNSGGAHRPGGAVYVRENWAISPDGSTHASGNAYWKTFRRVGNRWLYYGSYDGNLRQVNRGAGLQEQQPPTE